MAIQINGSTGVSGVNGTLANPVYRGGDADTGVFFPSLGQVAIVTNGVQRLLITETGSIQSDSALSFPAGSASAPGITFTGDANTGIYSPGADQVAVATNGTGRLFVDASGNVGVGQSLPGARLDVQGDIRSRSANPYFYLNNNTTQWGIRNNTNQLTFEYQTSERLRITSAGLVGIGTSAPSQKLSIDGSGGTLAGTAAISLFDSNSAGSRRWSISNGAGGNTVDLIGKLVFSYGNGSSSADPMSGIAAAVIDSSGRVGIGTTSPDTALTVLKNSSANFSSQANLRTSSHITFDNNQVTTALVFKGAPENSDKFIFSDNFGGTQNFGIGYLNGGTRVNSLNCTQNDAIIFNRTGSENGRWDSSGRLLVGTSTSPSAGQGQYARIVAQGFIGGATGAGIISIQRGSTAASSGDVLGQVTFGDNTGATFATIECSADGTVSSASDLPGRLTFSTTADGASSPTERMRITSGGATLIGTTNDNPAGSNTVGTCIGAGGSYLSATRDASFYLVVNRKTNDGDLALWQQDGTTEGSISVSGTTVSYNGAHLSRWSQLPSGAERTEILRGSVLSNIDEMCEWGEEDNEQLNRMKVSDVEGDKNVSGVFQAWDDDDDTYTNDFYCAMTGDFIIRIGTGVTVERGDLLMSAGDGTAKPQDDDIIRSKTIAKVTSTNVSCTYADGSYCVPCVLMAC